MNRKEKFDHIAIVIPAYNESKNLHILITKILEKYPAINVLVVDDSNKTEDLKLKKILSKFGKNVNVISRLKKMGRGSAVIDGLKFLLKNKKIKIFFEMDADLAHDPDELPLFLQGIKLNDMVVGSRYRSESKIIKWPIARLIQSRVINLFLKLLLGLNLSDYTNGYRAYSRRAVEFLVRQKLREKGFISLSEVAFKLKKGQFKISEVPITFRDRKFGKSSANVKELMVSLFGAFRIRFSEATPFFYAILSLIFFYFNYSFYTWNFFDRYFGLAGAKVIPELTGIAFFLFLSKVYLSKIYSKQKIKIDRRDFFTLIVFAGVGFIFHFKQFHTYFWKDDFYLVLNRLGGGYSFFAWGPWMSSYSLWVWELIRSFFGYAIFPYQLATILSHILLGIGVYFLAKYLSKNYYIGVISSLLTLTTTISFEAFEWLSHPINFAWQGFFVCLALIALVWEIEKNKGKKVPYLSAFIIMPAFGSGIARVGFVLPLISIVCFLACVKFFSKEGIFLWMKNLLRNQWIFYAMFFIFFFVRNLWTAGGSTRTEVITASIYKIYLYVVGIFSFPVEIFVLLSKLTPSHIPPGLITVFFGFSFQVLFFIAVLLVKIRKKKIPLIVSVGFFWMILSAVYFTKYGPHLPTADYEIDFSARTHHLAYLSSIGALMIWAYVIYNFIIFFQKVKKPYGSTLSALLIVGLMVINYSWLSKQYDNFLELPKGIKITRQQFFFETYRKYIPQDSKYIYIFYDDGSSKRKDNYKPSEYYFLGLWDTRDIRVLFGESDLKIFLNNISDKKLRDSEVANIYSIYTDYDNGLIESDLSKVLRESIINPKSKVLTNNDWKLIWGKNHEDFFYPKIIGMDGIRLSYFKNPTLTLTNLNFPAVLTPRLSMRLNITAEPNQKDFIDLRAGVLSNILTHWGLPDDVELDSLAKYYANNSSRDFSDFYNIVNTPNVNEKMICEKELKEGGIMFLISWVGEPDSYYSKMTPEDKNNIFSNKYNQRFYSLCYFSQVQGIKNINVDLSNTGSKIRGLVVVPITKDPVEVNLINSYLQGPKILK